MLFSEKEKETLLNLAREALHAAAHGFPLPVPVPVQGCERLWQESGGAFVTLTKRKMLRGCIGLMESDGMIADTIVHMATAAAKDDPRFQPVRPEELKDIRIEISLLTPLARVQSVQDIRLGDDGVLLRRGRRSGVFLPQVAKETGWDLETFLNELCVNKAGLPPHAWEDPETEVYRFGVEILNEPGQKK